MHVVVFAAPAAGQEHQICKNQQHYNILAQNLDVISMFPVEVYYHWRHFELIIFALQYSFQKSSQDSLT